MRLGTLSYQDSCPNFLFSVDRWSAYVKRLTRDSAVIFFVAGPKGEDGIRRFTIIPDLDVAGWKDVPAGVELWQTDVQPPVMIPAHPQGKTFEIHWTNSYELKVDGVAKFGIINEREQTLLRVE